MTRPTRDLLALSYSVDVSSIAVLVGWVRRGIRPHWIGYAPDSDRWPDTFVYRPIVDDWLASVGFPTITDVHTLPSIDDACADYFAAHIKAGGKVQRAIGYDAGPCDSKRGGVQSKGPWDWIYPLREWGWDRARCEKEIAAAGLPVPPKSACFYCPSTKPAELIQLAKRHPHLATRAVVMEDRARPKLTKIEGLWGTGVKGTRGGEKKPGSWRVFFAEHAPEVLPELPEPPEQPPVQPIESPEQEAA